MVSLMIRSNHFFIPSSSSSSSSSPKLPFQSLMVHPRRQQQQQQQQQLSTVSCDLVVFKERNSSFGFSCLVEKKGFGCSLQRLQRVSCPGSVRRRANKGSRESGDSSLEEEILEFMHRYGNPNHFPTKKELINGGRWDLVEAIEKQRGWLSLGWDFDEEEAVQEAKLEQEIDDLEDDDRMFQQRFDNGGENYSGDGALCAPSSSGREMEMENGEADGAGIEGILKGLEKERLFTFGFASKEKEYDASHVSKNEEEHDERTSGSPTLFGSKGGSITSLSPSNDLHTVSETTPPRKESFSKFHDLGKSLKPDMWRTWSLQRHSFSEFEFEASEIEQNVSAEDTTVIETSNETENMAENSQNYQNHIQSRLQHLELELASALSLLRSTTESFHAASRKGSENPSEALHELSDSWEFQETEIMNARDKLRSTRAKLAILEGKMALTMIEAQRVIGMKQKKIDNARKALHVLRTVCIIWPSSASEVLLCGSFDGWTSQRRMNLSSPGIFSLYLKLYPGRYEMKFIVDGKWRIDPLRPTVRNNGIENNLLIIS